MRQACEHGVQYATKAMTIALNKLAGLPGVGPLPKHYHHGPATPWSEGYVVILAGTSGDSWVGNFQEGYSYYSDTFLWPEASLFIVIALGACYLVSAEHPNIYKCYQTTATGVLFNEDRTKVFVADYSDLYAYDRTSAITWRREHLAVDGIELKECRAGFIVGSACYDPPEGWEDFRLSEADGTGG
jgi:hypothetical protein